MRVSRLGNSLMVRVPASVVAALRLREGDEVEVLGTADKQLYMTREPEPKPRQPAVQAERQKKISTTGSPAARYGWKTDPSP